MEKTSGGSPGMSTGHGRTDPQREQLPQPQSQKWKSGTTEFKNIDRASIYGDQRLDRDWVTECCHRKLKVSTTLLTYRTPAKDILI